MYNPFQMPNQMMQQKMIQQMQKQNPQLFNKVQEMMQGKNENQIREMANNIAKERGIDLNQFASQFGIKL